MTNRGFAALIDCGSESALAMGTVANFGGLAVAVGDMALIAIGVEAFVACGKIEAAWADFGMVASAADDDAATTCALAGAKATPPAAIAAVV